MPDEPAQAQPFLTNEQIESQGQEKRQEGQGHDVGVQDPQDKAEEREFGYGVVQALPIGQCVNDPGGPPPPPGLVGEDSGTGNNRPFQPLDPDPVPEAIAAPALGMNKFQGTLQV